MTAEAAPLFVAGDGTEPWHGKRSTYIRKKCRCLSCREVENEYQRNRYASRPDVRSQNIERATSWSNANRDLLNERQRQKILADPEPFRRKSRRHYHSHQDYYAAKNAEWRVRHPASARERSRRGWDRWSETNPEAVRTSKRRWAAANLPAQREATRRRRARLRALSIAPFTIDQLEQRLTMWPGCWICGGPKQAVDHVKPCAAGGAHCLANLRPICGPCNSGKGSTWHGPLWAASLVGRPGSWKEAPQC